MRLRVNIFVSRTILIPPVTNSFASRSILRLRVTNIPSCRDSKSRIYHLVFTSRASVKPRILVLLHITTRHFGAQLCGFLDPLDLRVNLPQPAVCTLIRPQFRLYPSSALPGLPCFAKILLSNAFGEHCSLFVVLTCPSRSSALPLSTLLCPHCVLVNLPILARVIPVVSPLSPVCLFLVCYPLYFCFLPSILRCHD